jgi:hypothetical protein
MQITKLFDFVHPTAIAMWNLRWQVKGYCDAVPDATNKDLINRFALGTNINGGSLKRATIDTSWEDQQEDFASIILINAIAAFEDFTAGVARASCPTNQQHRQKVEKNLQFPEDPTKQSRRGIALALMGPRSPSVAGAFVQDPSIQRRYSGPLIDNLLVCYRYFKEMRNAIAHNGGRADQKLIDAYNDFTPIATAATLGTPEVPHRHPLTAVGDPVKLSMRGVIGLSDIILRIIATYDADFSGYAFAETEILTRIGTTIKEQWVHSDDKKNNKRLTRSMNRFGLPELHPTPDFKAFLKAHGLVPAFI